MQFLCQPEPSMPALQTVYFALSLMSFGYQLSPILACLVSGSQGTRSQRTFLVQSINPKET
jgi:hypothetical protein